MLQTLKELLVVTVIAMAVFRLARPAALSFMTSADFGRRRNAWFALTFTAFLAPDIWVFMAVAAVILLRLGRRDPNPAAAFLLLLYAIPPMSVRVPMIGISFLVNLDYPLLLCLCLMLRPALRIFRSGKVGFDRLDFFVLAYLMLTSVFFALPEVSRGIVMTPTVTDNLRRMVETFLGLFIPYFVISRCGPTPRSTLENMAAYCLSAGVLAAIGVFESARHWLLYADIMSRLGGAVQVYLMRGDSLRAMASTGHSLALGVILAMTFAVWLGLQVHVKGTGRRFGITALFIAGLIAAYSRGPWIAAAVAFFLFTALRPRALPRLLQATLVCALIAGVIAMTPIGSRIAEVLPFLGGTVDSGNIDYRQRLFDRSWEVIQQSPLLGDRWALLKLQDLRQGQGIIDLMNGYTAILIGSGFAGLALYLAFVLLAFSRAWGFYRRSLLQSDPDLAMAGAGILACLAAISLLAYSAGTMTQAITLSAGLAAAVARSTKEPRARSQIDATRPTHS